METKRKALGRGLEELFNSESLELEKIESRIIESATKDEIVEVPLSDLRTNPYQPRKIFDEDALNELCESIKEYGVFQPIIVKKSIKGYDIIAGERRVKASRMAGLTTIPAIIRDFTDEQMREIALLENLQRENLTAIEEATAYRDIIDALQITQEEFAKKVGKSRSHVTNMLGLLTLPLSVQDLVMGNKISMGLLVDSGYKRKVEIKKRDNSESKEYKYIENSLEEKFGTKVKITNNKIQINYSSIDDLNRIIELLDINVED